VNEDILVQHISGANEGNRLKLLSYNIQVAIETHRLHHYVTRSWRHVLPHAKHLDNLDQIAGLLHQYDIVGLQEVDAGSLRSGFINQTEYLATQADFLYWNHQTNRRIGNIAKHSNGFLSQIVPANVTGHKLPGFMPGRGAMVVQFGEEKDALMLVLLHLALGKRARSEQLRYVSELVRSREHVIVMGDMNCQPRSEELQSLLLATGLRAPVWGMNTYPSWKPTKQLDHILVSPSLIVENVEVLDVSLSDHLPISMDVILPDSVALSSTKRLAVG